MFSISSEAKVGLFVLVGLIVLGYMSFQVGQRGFTFKRGYMVEVEFDNAAGLSHDAAVQIAGVEVGRVENIRLKDGKALVTMRFPGEVKLEKDVTAAIKTHGILGDKYIEIVPGTRGASYLQAGESISRVERQADIDKLLNQLAAIAEDVKTVTGSLSKSMGGKAGEESIGAILENTRLLTRNLNAVVMNNEATLRAMLENTKQLTGNLNRVVVQNDDKIAQVIESLRGASSQMEKTFTALNEITDGIRRGEGTVGQLVKDKAMADRLNKTMASLQEVSDKINKGQGTLGKLVNDDETVKNLNQTLGGINKFINKSEQFRTFISYRGEYLTEKSDAKSYLDLRIQPRQDYFYLLGLVTDPRGRRTVKDITTQGGATTQITEWDKSGLLFNAQIGKRYQDIVVRGGVFESTGGGGVDFMSFKDKLKLSFEAFDFASDRNAHLKAGGELRLLKNIYLNAGWDDFINKSNQSPYVGVSLRFEDDDLKYLLTSVPVPTK